MSEPGGRLADIVVVDPGPRPIPIYDAVRRFTRLNIRQARKLVDAPPQAIITQVPLRQAEALKTPPRGGRPRRGARRKWNVF